MKEVLKEIFRNFGFEITRYNPNRKGPFQQVKALEMADINLVFDIGANEGQFASEIRKYGYRGKIVSFEPLSSARKNLLSLASKEKEWEVHEQSAIGDKDGMVEFHIAGNSVSSSVLPMLESHSIAAEGSAYVGSEQVPMVRLDSVSNQYLTPSSNLLIKIDAQGFEWEVLEGATECLKKARGILCELSLAPLYENQILWRDIIDRLEAEGFVLWALHKGFTDLNTGRSLQMDGIFFRRELELLKP